MTRRKLYEKTYKTNLPYYCLYHPSPCRKLLYLLFFPLPLLSRFGPEKVPGFVHIFFRELFCNSFLVLPLTRIKSNTD